MKMTRLKSLLVLTLLIIATTITAITYSWLSDEKIIEVTAEIGELKSTMDVVINKDGNRIDAISLDTCYDPTRKLLKLNGTSKSYLENDPTQYFVEDLEVSVKANPEVASYLRVKVQDEWEVTRTNRSGRQQIYTDYKAELSFPFYLVDNEGNIETTENADTIKWYYYDGYVYFADMLDGGTEYNLPFIKGGDSYKPVSSRFWTYNCILYLDIVVEMVQANRYQEVWGLTEYPRRDING